MELVLIPPGEFVPGEPDSPQRPRVTVRTPFYLGATEVTQAQYAAVTGRNPSLYPAPGNPVEQVSWHEAVAFCRDAGERTGFAFSLPTESEWEYACRAGDARAVPWPPDLLAGNAWCRDNSGRRPRPVAARPANAWGLHDMLGNVSEWCAQSRRSPPGSRVLAGPMYWTPAAEFGPACRFELPADDSDDWTGFRVRMSVEGAAAPRD
jgi:formylglycine-generating enzyme required for sulfatase activity